MIRITTLVENTTKDKALESKHGLSFYIETYNHKILFDLGPDGTLFRNAESLSIDLSDVDTVVISHGHVDHGGALRDFLKVNSKAKIYMHRQSFDPYYYKIIFAKKYVGLDRKLVGNERFIFTDNKIQIDDELYLFSNVNGQFDTNGNRKLLKKTVRGYERDDFAHEQNLIIMSEGKTALFTGCSHRGIANILHMAYAHEPSIQVVFGGFHLYNPATKTTEPLEVAQGLAKDISEYDATFYTGHCTGYQAFKRMHDIMGDKVRQIFTGMIIDL